MISHKYKCIFVHLRRTGGNSIEMALGGISLFDASGDRTDVWDNNIHRGYSKYKKDNRGHYMHADARDIALLHPQEFSSYFKFSFVRNPWDQMISLFFRLNPQCSPETHFKSWLRGFIRVKGTVPSVSLFDSSGNCLVDFIGQFENMENDFNYVCQKLSIKEGLSLPKTNPSNKGSYSQYYDKESFEMVRKLYELDIEHFGFDFEQ